MTTIGIIDAGPFVAWASTDDLRHAAMRAILQDSSLRLVVPALVITEATYLIASRLGPHAEAALLGRDFGGETVRFEANTELLATQLELFEEKAVVTTDLEDFSVLLVRADQIEFRFAVRLGLPRAETVIVAFVENFGRDGITNLAEAALFTKVECQRMFEFRFRFFQKTVRDRLAAQIHQ